MRYILILIIFFSSNLFSQGNLGVNFGLNDDNFGTIENISNKIDNYNLDIKNSTGFSDISVCISRNIALTVDKFLLITAPAPIS